MGSGGAGADGGNIASSSRKVRACSFFRDPEGERIFLGLHHESGNLVNLFRCHPSLICIQRASAAKDRDGKRISTEVTRVLPRQSLQVRRVSEGIACFCRVLVLKALFQTLFIF